MKKFLTFIFSLLACVLMGQNAPKTKQQGLPKTNNQKVEMESGAELNACNMPELPYGHEKNFKVADKMPQFVGGDSAMLKYIYANLCYPSNAIANNIEGKSIISFVVDTFGMLKNIKLERAIGGGCDEEALKVVHSMPKWISGKWHNKPIDAKYILGISFRIKNEDTYQK